MYKKVILFFLVSTVNIFSINLLLLKDINKILDEESQEYAPSNGVPFAEGIAEALYDQSAKSIKIKILESIEKFKCSEKKKNQLRSDFENYFQTASQEELTTLKLVTLLFHKVGAQFQLTEAPNNPLRQLTPKNIGEIFKIILDIKQEFKRQSVTFLTKEEEQKYVLNLKIKLKADLENYLQNLNLQKSSGSLFKPKDFNPFIQALIGSLWECDEFNPVASFTPFTTEKILLAYLLGRSNNKEDLKKYFEGLLGKSFELSNKKYTKQELRGFTHKNIDLSNFDSFSDWLTIAFYKKNYMSGLPKMATTKMVSYDNILFPDCVETTIRNLCNIITYNGNFLGAVKTNLHMSNTLASFYKKDKANSPSEIFNQDVHQAWVDGVTNIEGLSYLCLKKRKGWDYIKLPLEYAGFMPVDDSIILKKDLEKLPKKEFLLDGEKIQLYAKKVGNLTYLLVPKKSQLLCFELLPMVSNILVSLHNLFNLNLYKPEEIFDQNFSEKYFKSLCHKLNWSLGKTIKSHEQTIIKIYKEESSFQIEILPQMHSSVRMIKDKTIEIMDKQKFEYLLQQKYSSKMSLLVPLFNSSFSMNNLFQVAGNNVQSFLHILRHIRFQSVEKKVNVIEQVLNMRLNSAEIDRYLAGLIVTLPAKNGDYLKFILENFNRDFYNYLKNILETTGSTRFLGFVVESLDKNGDFDISCSNLHSENYFSDIIKNSFKQYFYMIAANLKRSEIIDLLCSLMLFDILSFQEMIPFLKYDIESILPFLKKSVYSADDILSYLILARKITFKEVMSFAEKYRHIEYMIDLLFFFNRVTKIDFNEFMPFLEKGMNNSSKFVKMRTLILIKELAEKKRITFCQAKPFLKEVFKEKAVLEKINVIEYLLEFRAIEVISVFARNEEISFLEVKSFLKKGVKSLNSKAVAETFNIIKDLLYQYKITFPQAEPFIKTTMKLDSNYFEDVKEEAKRIFKWNRKKYEKKFKSAQQGLLKKTKILSMRHEPYNFENDAQDQEGHDMNADFTKYENFYNNYVFTNFDSNEVQLSDLDFQEYKTLKEQRDLKLNEQKKLDNLENYKDLNKTSLNSLLVNSKTMLTNISQVAEKIALRLVR